MRGLLQIFAVVLAGFFAANALPAHAQETASLISDRLSITGDTRLIAEGNVEVFFQGRSLRASRIIYDQAADRLLIEGPIVLTETGGDTLILASQADLAADLSEGLLTSARMVLNQQLQLAANEIQRIDGRYTALNSVVASSCKVCASHPVPLWEIRAARVVHDQEERQLYFDHAQFRLAGVPVFYIPRLRMPDPSLDRATGFLQPKLRTTSLLGTGLKLPYFIALGENRDLTVTPYITTKGGRSVELRYRQAFRTGQIDVTGATSRDDILPGESRGYLFATGQFALPENYRLDLKLQAVSDPAYLLDYGISDTDRLDSRITIDRTRRNEYISGRVISFQSLRDDEDNNTLPSVVADLTFHRRFSLGPLGGEGGLRLQTHNHWRSSSDPLDGPDDDLIADGRDLSRISARLDWRRSFLLPGGVEAVLLGEASGDIYSVGQDATYSGNYSRSHTAAGVELRWPLVKATGTGAMHVIEPIAQLVWADSDNNGIPNEDSTLLEFDEGNLFSLNRFPGSDAVEQGRRANIGMIWTRYDPRGWSMALTMGRIYRERDYGQFGPASGLAGETSDWLAGVNFTLPQGYSLAARATFDGDFELSKAEGRLSLNRDKLALAASMLWVEADPLFENRPTPTREFSFDASWKASQQLTTRLVGSYDFEGGRGTLAGLGLEYRTDCIAVDLSLSRRFTSSTNVTPTTDFGLSFELIGINGKGAAGPSRRCS
ncbi:LPS assembly protein LptD [Xinfangfangia sp. CPCC 101601]|uniref:LPS-assembly protein LptD n=1 Tax=Pseudogemmobacter lacusdianii TaxID=3069608 RepID=A0ABU0VV57_9RHOB|nr:LPS assembly protein LptD [Xinfangfangia sp. CPCC 101601]MDQ2065607.1 LPS assembly protein LptD [Xinfangfangia sp. CPCC 101601]